MKHSVDYKTLASEIGATGISTSTGVDFSEYLEGLLLTKITSISGSISFTLEGSYDDSSYYPLPVTLPAQSIVGSKDAVAVTNFGSYVRLKRSVSVGGSVDYSVIFLGKT